MTGSSYSSGLDIAAFAGGFLQTVLCAGNLLDPDVRGEFHVGAGWHFKVADKGIDRENSHRKQQEFSQNDENTPDQGKERSKLSHHSTSLFVFYHR